MSSPASIGTALSAVEGFVEALVRRDYGEAARRLRPDATFVNGTLATVHGRDEIVASLRPVLDAVDALDWPITRSAHDGATVLVERVDRFRVGERWAEIPVVGVFELDEAGLIAAWRDYFDAAAGQAALESLRA